MSKDVIVDRYARLYEIPHQLALLGHDVHSFCLDYHHQTTGQWEHPSAPGRLSWESKSLGRFRVAALLGYPWFLLKRLRALAPDVIIGASDIPHVVLAAWLAKKLGVPYVSDLYDNFEGFGQARIPGFVPALRLAVRHADLVTTTSARLRKLVIADYEAHGHVLAVPSAVNKAIFRPQLKGDCRRELGLPQDASLFGTAGGLCHDKGISVLLDAWKVIESRTLDVHLVLAGPLEPGLAIPVSPRVHFLGALPHERVAQLFCALDVGVVCVLDTPFGRYSFPQKAYEMLACGLPVVAADIGDMSDLFAQTPECLYRIDQPLHLADQVQRQLASPIRPTLEIDDWVASLSKVETQISRLVALKNTVSS